MHMCDMFKVTKNKELFSFNLLIISIYCIIT